jgi:predicted nucleic acid-binding protein
MPASSLDVFVDSNCWLYLYLSEQDPSKRDRLLDCLASCERPIISTQVLTEIGANLCKKARASEDRQRAVLQELTCHTTILPVTPGTMYRASHLRSSGTWSYWDSLNVASALDANCTELWSEDLQDGRVVEEQLRIINPFRDHTNA